MKEVLDKIKGTEQADSFGNGLDDGIDEVVKDIKEQHSQQGNMIGTHKDKEVKEETNTNVKKTYTDKETGKFVKGNPGGGRPKGTISITTKIKQYYKENPEEFEDLCKYYREHESMKKVLWNYVDGMPKQESDVNVTGNINLGELNKLSKEDE